MADQDKKNVSLPKRKRGRPKVKQDNRLRVTGVGLTPYQRWVLESIRDSDGRESNSQTIGMLLESVGERRGLTKLKFKRLPNRDEFLKGYLPRYKTVSERQTERDIKRDVLRAVARGDITSPLASDDGFGEGSCRFPPVAADWESYNAPFGVAVLKEILEFKPTQEQQEAFGREETNGTDTTGHSGRETEAEREVGE